MSTHPDFEDGLDEVLDQARSGRGQSGKKARACTLCLVVEHAKPHAKDQLRDAAAGTISARALHRALRETGIQIERANIYTHRNEGHKPS